MRTAAILAALSFFAGAALPATALPAPGVLAPPLPALSSSAPGSSPSSTGSALAAPSPTSSNPTAADSTPSNSMVPSPTESGSTAPDSLESFPTISDPPLGLNPLPTNDLHHLPPWIVDHGPVRSTPPKPVVDSRGFDEHDDIELYRRRFLGSTPSSPLSTGVPIHALPHQDTQEQWSRLGNELADGHQGARDFVDEDDAEMVSQYVRRLLAPAMSIAPAPTSTPTFDGGLEYHIW